MCNKLEHKNFSDQMSPFCRIMMTYEHSFSISTIIFVDDYKSIKVFSINRLRQHQHVFYVWNIDRCNNNMESRLSRRCSLSHYIRNRQRWYTEDNGMRTILELVFLIKRASEAKSFMSLHERCVVCNLSDKNCILCKSKFRLYSVTVNSVLN